jgi:hypothetical protein
VDQQLNSDSLVPDAEKWHFSRPEIVNNENGIRAHQSFDATNEIIKRTNRFLPIREKHYLIHNQKLTKSTGNRRKMSLDSSFGARCKLKQPKLLAPPFRFRIYRHLFYALPFHRYLPSPPKIGLEGESTGGRGRNGSHRSRHILLLAHYFGICMRLIFMSASLMIRSQSIRLGLFDPGKGGRKTRRMEQIKLKDLLKRKRLIRQALTTTEPGTAATAAGAMGLNRPGRSHNGSSGDRFQLFASIPGPAPSFLLLLLLDNAKGAKRPPSLEAASQRRQSRRKRQTNQSPVYFFRPTFGSLNQVGCIGKIM